MFFLAGNNDSEQNVSKIDPEFKALVIDDNREVLELTKVYLDREVDPLELETTDSPREALEKLENDNYDAVISDYWMPEIDGLELLEKVRENGKDTPFILFTGKGSEEVAMEAINKEANAYVPKKHDLKERIKELADKVSDLVQKKKQEIISENKNLYYEKNLQETSMMGQLAQKSARGSDGIDELKNVFSVLSKDGSLPILDSARDGIRSGRGSWNEYGLSKRQYYSRLNSLQDSGMLEKNGSKYILTDIGKKLLDIISGLGVLTKSAVGPIESLDKPPEDMNELLDASLVGEELYDNVDFNQAGFVSVTDYSGFVDQLANMIRGAAEEIHFAASFMDQRILRAFADMKDDVKLEVVISGDASDKTQDIIGGLLSEEEAELLKNKIDGSVKRCRKVPFSFLLQDHEWLNLEIKNPLYSGNFFHGFLLKGSQVYDSFVDLFDGIHKGSESVQLLKASS